MTFDVKMPITLISAVFQHGIILTARVIHSFDGASLKRRFLMNIARSVRRYCGTTATEHDHACCGWPG